MPLGEYVNGRFYRGLVTGLNEAFVVDRATRDKLLGLAKQHNLEIISIEQLIAHRRLSERLVARNGRSALPSQMAMELAWYMTVTDEEPWIRVLDDVILLLAPSINPDGQQMVVDWYRKHLGTEYEGGRMPWLYHHYAGHDNNRDWFMLNLPETRAVNRVLYHDWFPQVYLDIHQMGSTGPRMFVPPFQDPIGVNIHPLIWRLTDLFGTEMAVRLQEDGRLGVIDGFAYDGYWPGGTMNTADGIPRTRRSCPARYSHTPSTDVHAINTPRAMACGKQPTRFLGG